MSRMGLCKQYIAHPQCFMFWGLSMRTAILIVRLSGQCLLICILYHSGVRGLVAVGCKSTRPNSLSSKLSIPELSVKSFTFTTGRQCCVVKSPWVSQLEKKANNEFMQPFWLLVFWNLKSAKLKPKTIWLAEQLEAMLHCLRTCSRNENYSVNNIMFCIKKCKSLQFDNNSLILLFNN
jgi:hypothetical protein